MKRPVALFIIILFAGIYMTLYTLLLNVSAVNILYSGEAGKEAPVSNTYRDSEARLLNFIEKRMLGEDGGIYTNVKLSARMEGTLSESVGLFMNYCIIRDNQESFDKEMNYLNKHILTEDHYVKWKDSKEKVTCNALIDDLRIIRALLDAYDKWGNKAYLDTAGFIQDRIFKKQVENDLIYELYDWNIGKSKKIIPLCYMDLYTMDRMGKFNKGWLRAEEEGKNIISNGKINSESPFFYKYYDYTLKRYLPDEEYKKNNEVCLTYTLYTVLHLAEVNQDTGKFADWLIKEMDKGRLYAWYDPESLKPANDSESTAVYALAAVYSKKIGENELYNKLVNRMLEFMVTDADSPNYGGFGNEDTSDFYSFDNLTALWALALE